jgi:hypothetical protein
MPLTDSRAHTRGVAVIAPEALTATGWQPVDETARYWRHELRYGPAVFDRFEVDAIENRRGRTAEAATSSLAKAQRQADSCAVVLYLIVVLCGLILGLIVGRWWALAAAAAVGLWIATTTGVDEVPPWFLGAAYAVLAGAGVLAGIGVRKLLPSRG